MYWRQRRSRAESSIYWRQQIADWKKSGQKIREFCSERNLTESQFDCLRRTAADSPAVAPNRAQRLLASCGLFVWWPGRAGGKPAGRRDRRRAVRSTANGSPVQTGRYESDPAGELRPQRMRNLSANILKPLGNGCSSLAQSPGPSRPCVLTRMKLFAVSAARRASMALNSSSACCTIPLPSAALQPQNWSEGASHGPAHWGWVPLGIGKS